MAVSGGSELLFFPWPCEDHDGFRCTRCPCRTKLNYLRRRIFGQIADPEAVELGSSSPTSNAIEVSCRATPSRIRISWSRAHCLRTFFILIEICPWEIVRHENNLFSSLLIVLVMQARSKLPFLLTIFLIIGRRRLHFSVFINCSVSKHATL